VAQSATFIAWGGIDFAAGHVRGEHGWVLMHGRCCV
jgi:hypothetical protein